MQRTQQYAQWLTNNQSKKGSPEWNTVAEAYKAARQQPQKPNTSFASAIAYGADAPLERMAETAKALGFESTGDFLSGVTKAPENYESAANRFINPEEGDSKLFGFGIEYMPRAFFEQLGNLGGSIASRVGGAAVGSAGGPVGAAVGAFTGPALFEFVQQLGPIANQRAKNNGRDKPTYEDWAASATASGLSGALNAIGVKGVPLLNKVNNSVLEGTTEFSQSLVQQTGETVGTEKGLELDPRQAVGEGLLGAGARATIDTSVAAVNSVKTLRNPQTNEATDPEAAADLAGRLQKIASENKLNLKQVSPTGTKGAREAVDKAHVQLAEELKTATTVLNKRLQINRNTDNEQTLETKTLARAALREARNKTKNLTGQSEYNALRDLVQDTSEGQNLLKIVRQLNELTTLHNAGLKGGVSQFTDQFSIFGSNPGYDRTAIQSERILRPLVSGSLGASTGGASLAGQTAIVGAGRAIDALTGRRSRVNRYVNQNRGQQGITPEQRGSLLASEQRQQQGQALQRALQAQQRRQANAQAAQATRAAKVAGLEAGDPPKRGENPSPEGAMFDALIPETGLIDSGLTPNQVRRQISDVFKELRRTRPDLKSAISAYNLARVSAGTAKIPNLNQLIQAVQGNLSRKSGKTARPNTVGTGNTTIIKQGPMTPRERGRQDNLAFLDKLETALRDDKAIEPIDKAIAMAALKDFRLDLGKDPVTEIKRRYQEAVEKAKNPEAVQKYLDPYLQRVLLQQGPQQTPQQPQTPQEPLQPTPAEPIIPNEPEPTGVTPNEPISGQGSSGQGVETKTTKEEPTKTDVKTADDAAKVLFEIGKKGSLYENGISEMDSVRTLGEALGLKVNFYNDQESLRKASRGNSKGLRGFFDPSDKSINVLLEGGSLNRGAIDALGTALHELGHGIDASQSSRDMSQRYGGIFDDPNYFEKKSLGRNRIILKGGLTDKLIRKLDTIRKSETDFKDLKHPLYLEMIEFQQKSTRSSPALPNEVPIRTFYQRLEESRQRQLAQNPTVNAMSEINKYYDKQLQNEMRDYFATPAELLADALMKYMMNPAVFKQEAPMTAEFIRDVVNEGRTNNLIKFYSLPVAGVLAVAASILAAEFGDEEELRSQIA